METNSIILSPDSKIHRSLIPTLTAWLRKKKVWITYPIVRVIVFLGDNRLFLNARMARCLAGSNRTIALIFRATSRDWRESLDEELSVSTRLHPTSTWSSLQYFNKHIYFFNIIFFLGLRGKNWYRYGIAPGRRSRPCVTRHVRRDIRDPNDEKKER